MQSKQYQTIIEAVKKQKEIYSNKNKNKNKKWKKSPFEWIVKSITSRQKGKVGEEIVKELLESHDFKVPDSHGTDFDIMVNDYKVEVKFSTLWEKDVYSFQQIRQQKYDILFCLGVSPDGAHAWVVGKGDIKWDEMKKQHGGERGKGNTWWIKFKPHECPYKWMKPNNGDLSKVCEELSKVCKKLKKTAQK